MRTIERSIEVGIPASASYDLWTQFELFPHFMKGIESVEQRDDRHLHWKATVAGQTEEWDAEITEQIPDKRIAWRSEAGTHNAGVVTFHRLSDDTSRVMLQMKYEPRRWSEKLGDALGFVARRVEGDLGRFKRFAERYGDRAQGWRGRVPAAPDAAQRRKAGDAPTRSSPSGSPG